MANYFFLQMQISLGDYDIWDTVEVAEELPDGSPPDMGMRPLDNIYHRVTKVTNISHVLARTYAAKQVGYGDKKNHPNAKARMKRADMNMLPTPLKNKILAPKRPLADRYDVAASKPKLGMEDIILTVGELTAISVIKPVLP